MWLLAALADPVLYLSEKAQTACPRAHCLPVLLTHNHWDTTDVRNKGKLSKYLILILLMYLLPKKKQNIGNVL